MLQYNKFRTGDFKRNFVAMDKLRTKMLIKTEFEDCGCDSIHSNLNKEGIARLKLSIKVIEARRGIMRQVLHTAMANGESTFKS